MNYDADDVKERISEMCTHLLFDLDGVPCGVDPISSERIDLWYGEKAFTAKSVEEAMQAKIFNGESLSEIAEQVEIDGM